MREVVRSSSGAEAAAKSHRSQRMVQRAIILVVIGLIVAGIVKGQELIAGARLKSTLADVEMIRAAAAAFRERHGGFPGDYALAQVRLGTPNGVTWRAPRCDGADRGCDGDGIVEGNGRNDETLLFWQHLTLDNLISGIVVGAAVDDSIGVGLPAVAIGGGLAIQHQAIGGRTAHWLRLGTGPALTSGVATGEQALGIDSEIDDGRPHTGSVRVTTEACIDRGGYDPSGEACLIYFELE